MKIYLILTAVLCIIALLLPVAAVGFTSEVKEESLSHTEEIVTTLSSR